MTHAEALAEVERQRTVIAWLVLRLQSLGGRLLGRDTPTRESLLADVKDALALANGTPAPTKEKP